MQNNCDGLVRQAAAFRLQAGQDLKRQPERLAGLLASLLPEAGA